MLRDPCFSGFGCFVGRFRGSVIFRRSGGRGVGFGFLFLGLGCLLWTALVISCSWKQHRQTSSRSSTTFKLSALGETIYFKNAAQTRILDAVRFAGQENGVATGRFP